MFDDFFTSLMFKIGGVIKFIFLRLSLPKISEEYLQSSYLLK